MFQGTVGQQFFLVGSSFFYLTLGEFAPPYIPAQAQRHRAEHDLELSNPSIVGHDWNHLEGPGGYSKYTILDWDLQRCRIELTCHHRNDLQGPLFFFNSNSKLTTTVTQKILESLTLSTNTKGGEAWKGSSKPKS